MFVDVYKEVSPTCVTYAVILCNCNLNFTHAIKNMALFGPSTVCSCVKDAVYVAAGSCCAPQGRVWRCSAPPQRNVSTTCADTPTWWQVCCSNPPTTCRYRYPTTQFVNGDGKSTALTYPNSRTVSLPRWGLILTELLKLNHRCISCPH